MATGGPDTESAMESHCEESSNKTNTEEDLYLLVECLRYQQNCLSAQKQALTTIATMCSNSNSSRNSFNSTGGLSYVSELLFESKSYELQQAVMYTLGCACENNLVNQLKLCNERLFLFLVKLLVPETIPGAPDTLGVAVAYLSGCLIAHNVQAQRLAKDSGLLSKLISMFKSTLPSSDASTVNSQHKHKLWSSVTSALCTATNNPQNDTNQCECIKLFPAALSILHMTTLDENVVRLSISLIASCTANNKAAQDRLRMIGGLKALVHILYTVLQCMNSSGKLFELPLHIVKALSAVALGHRANCEALVELECIELLLCLLQCSDLSVSTKLNVVVCLGMLTEENVVGQRKVVNTEGVCLLVDVMATSQSQQLSQATTFLLQCCVEKSSHLSPLHDEFAEKITVMDRVITNDQAQLNQAIQNVNGQSFAKDVLENLPPSQDLVTAWLDTHVPGNNLSKADHDNLPEPSEQSEAKAQDSSDNSQLILELNKEKELRERLETMLKVEREEREKLEKKLLLQQETATKELPNVQHSPHTTTIDDTTIDDTPPVTSRTNIRYAITAKTTQINKQTNGIILSEQNCHTTPPPFTQPLSRAYRELDCYHQCIACKPRLKCPIINSRNFIKLIKIDRYTCSYHRRISFKLKKDSLPLTRPPLRPKQAPHSVPHTSPKPCEQAPHSVPHTSPKPCEQAPHSVPHSSPKPCEQAPHSVPHTSHSEPPVSPAGSTASSIISVGQETNLYSHPANPTDVEDDYIASPTPSPPHEASPTPSPLHEASPTPSPLHEASPTQAKKNTRPQPNSVQMQQGFNPTTYRLLPRTCGQPSNRLKKKMKPRPLAEITNKRAGRRADPLSVFDYSTPEGPKKHRPTSKVALHAMKFPRKRAKAVLWTRQEESFLREGVQMVGLGQWRHILAAYPFHQSRDSSSLRVKYRNMQS